MIFSIIALCVSIAALLFSVRAHLKLTRKEKKPDQPNPAAVPYSTSYKDAAGDICTLFTCGEESIEADGPKEFVEFICKNETELTWRGVPINSMTKEQLVDTLVDCARHISFLEGRRFTSMT